MECAMKPGIRLLLIVIMASISIPASRGSTCDYVAKSRPRGTYEPVMIKVKAYDQNGHSTEKEIPFCLIKDDEECFPNNFYITEKGLKINELAEMEKHMKLHLPAEKNRIFGIGAIDKYFDIIGDNDDSRRFRGFSCKSGICHQDYYSAGSKAAGICISSTCKPPRCTKDHSIDWIRFLELQDQERFMIDYKAWLQKRKYDYEQELKNELEKTNCAYVERETEDSSNDIRNNYGPLQTRNLARIEIEKGGGEFMIGICTIRDGRKCFPNTKEEFMALKKHLEAAKVFPEFTFAYPETEPTSEKPPKPANDDKSTPALKLKSWNCYSGVCDSESLKCTAKTPGEARVSRVWKLYEYKAHNKGVRNTGFISLFLVIKLTVALISLG